MWHGSGMIPTSIIAFLAVSLYLHRVHSCESGSLRLTDGFDNSSGRVELCHEGAWGTVCDDYWAERSARVVCRQLGLPSKVVSALSGYGGGEGEILLDTVRCNGTEQRLEDCPHNGIGIHNCALDHHEDAGVVCHSDEDEDCHFMYSPSLKDPDQCNATQSQPSRTCVHRYGSCVPFYPLKSPTVCDDLYEAGVDYVYVPHNRSRGSFSRLIEDSAEYGPVLLSSLNKCYEPARRVLCHFFFPPCGNSTVFKAPTAVCPEQCRLISQLCPEEWAEVVRKYMLYDFEIAEEGLRLIDCDFPGKHLIPLPHCCTDAGINITLLANMDKTGSDIKGVFSGIAALIVVTLLIVVPVVCVFIKWHQRQREMVISNPVTYGRSIKKIDVVVDAAPPVTDRYTHDKNTSNTSTLKPHGGDHGIKRVMSAFIRQMSEENLLVPEKNIKLLDIVGQGEFGVVYRGTLSNWKEHGRDVVAIKTLKGMFSTSELKHLVEESKIMSKFDHPNVMKLFGVAISKRHETLYVLMPYMTQGSLLSYLKKHRCDLMVEYDDMTDSIKETGSKLLSICLQIAKGMNYLANQKFVHRDLAARNCMIDENYVIKVADFGLSEDIYARNYFRQAGRVEEGESPVKLPVRWMALESLNDGIFTEKSDVWSFGVTCWEVFSLGKNPYPGVDPFTLVRYLERGERLDRPLNVACSQEIFDIMGSCWNALPEKRPTFSELVTVISSHLEEMAGYLDLTVLPLTTECNMEDHSLEKLVS